MSRKPAAVQAPTTTVVGALPPASSAPVRRLVAAGFIRRWAGRTITVRATPAGVTGTITPAPVRVANYDNYGSLWGYETAATAEQDITAARANGATVDEWETTDRDGQPLRIVRMADPTFLDTISVFTGGA
ncbi:MULTISPECIES: hypothetical protein [Streptomyces]|uniref:Uncharacterized protein n=2 Tax=Streptomyces TaxID=1883 RepID=A0ABV9IPK9_9ACTN